jgi:hypothetical protein
MTEEEIEWFEENCLKVQQLITESLNLCMSLGGLIGRTLLVTIGTTAIVGNLNAELTIDSQK